MTGVALWVIVYGLFTVAMLGMQLFSDRIIWLPFFWGFVECVVAMVAAGLVYREA